MTGVDETVRESILCYPSLYANRTQVLHSILCVVGNGFYWDENGEASLRYPEDKEHWSPEAEVEIFNKNCSDDPLLVEILAPRMEKRLQEYQERVDAVETLKFKVGPLGSVYPQTGSCLLMNIPDNVSEDWRAACEEIQWVVSAYGWKPQSRFVPNQY